MENQYIDKDILAASENKKEEKKKRISKPRKNNKTANTLIQIINGEILTKDLVLNNLGFFFFCILLLILIVAKGYYGKQLTQNIDSSLKKFDATSAEYVEAKASLEEKTKRYELVKILEPMGLKETTKPAKVIRVKKEG
jgi:hypothetical protein